MGLKTLGAKDRIGCDICGGVGGCVCVCVCVCVCYSCCQCVIEDYSYSLDLVTLHGIPGISWGFGEVFSRLEGLTDVSPVLE